MDLLNYMLFLPLTNSTWPIKDGHIWYQIPLNTIVYIERIL
jgi:hypothetical protein